jgi:hypothetical protein
MIKVEHIDLLRKEQPRLGQHANSINEANPNSKYFGGRRLAQSTREHQSYADSKPTAFKRFSLSKHRVNDRDTDV